jgi:hypothetical protein
MKKVSVIVKLREQLITEIMLTTTLIGAWGRVVVKALRY